MAGTADEARGGGATIAEELFAEGLLKLVETVPSLPSLGRKNKWDYEAPERILYYLTRAVKSGIYDCYRAASRFRGPPKKRTRPCPEKAETTRTSDDDLQRRPWQR